jgi:hypothetical protein
MSSLDLRLYQEIEKYIVEQLERHAAEVVGSKSVDWPDYKFRCGVIKGLKDALSIAKEANDELIGINREER